MIPNIGPTELVILLFLVLLLFGAKRIPELAKGLGGGIREFRKGALGQDDNLEPALNAGENQDRSVR